MSTVIISYGSIEPIHAHVKYTLDVRDEDEQWRIIGEILFGVDTHEATKGLLNIAERYSRGLKDCTEVRIQGYKDARTLKKV